MAYDVTFLVVAKAPVAGLAKTRLSPAITPHEGASLAAAALLDTLDVVRRVARRRPVVAMTGELNQAQASGAIRRALGDFTVIEQRGHDFAYRLANAHRDACPPDRPIFQVGMDTPQLSAEHLNTAQDLLGEPDGSDVLLGPAVDGGWWGLGLREAGWAGALCDVPMSHSNTGELTRDAFFRAGHEVRELAELHDVDEVSDIAAVCEAAPETRFAVLGKTLIRHLTPTSAPLTRGGPETVQL